MRKSVLLLIVLSLALFAPAHPAQEKSQSISKVAALESVSTVPGWREVISDEGRFRVLFPGEPKINDDVATVKSLEFIWARGKWVQTCSNVSSGRPDNESVRNRLRDAFSYTLKKRSRLIAERDVTLNGRVGLEAVVVYEAGKITYLRAFVNRDRMYTVSVQLSEPPNSKGSLPAEVNQFFESFVYWD